MSIIASPAPFTLTLPERDNSALPSECGAPCTTTCNPQYGGGPNPNDCVSLVKDYLVSNGAHHVMIYIWKFGTLTLLSAVATYTLTSGVPLAGLNTGVNSCVASLGPLTATQFSYCGADWVGDCVILSNICLNNIACSGWCCTLYC
jgi:hypothetical protein